MKIKIKWRIFMGAIFLGVAVAGCSTMISSATVSSRDWQFIQSVGGIAVGKPVRAGGRVTLPIRCNVSGGETITVQHTVINSSLVCRPPQIRVREGRVFVTIRTSLPDKRYPDCRCSDADLGIIAAGDYPVIYLSPNGEQHPIGNVHVPR